MSLYLDIYNDIKSSILTNHYRAGKPLPTQETLIKKYNTSRITLKKALDKLQEEGLIYSHQGSGTFVRPHLFDTDDELLPLDLPIGATYTHRDQKITSKVFYFNARLPNDIEQKKLYLSAEEPVYEIKRIRYINDKFYSYEHTIMPTKIAVIDKDVLNNSIYGYLGSKHIFLTDARRVIYAENTTTELAKLLDIKVNSPLLVIEQVAFNQNGIPFEYSKSRFIGNHSHFSLDIHRDMHDILNYSQK